jgi:small subunit ribosomal protein S10
MQALARSSRVQPFTSMRPCAAASLRPVASRPAPRISQRLVGKAAAEDTAIDFSEYADDVDVTAGSSAVSPISSENVKLRVRMRGYDITLLRDAVDQIRTVAEATGVEFKGPVMLPTRRKVFCVLRSPHVDKDAREHFEVRTHHRLVDLKNLSSQAVEAMMQWVPPPGLEVECSIVAA